MTIYNMDDFNIENVNNYRECYNVDEKEILSRYNVLINDFLTQSHEAIKINNKPYFIYIIINGIETITHVYRFLLMYTKNSELVCYNCKKSVYYYIEFITQLSRNKGAVLKLTVKDASLFVYRKTIFAVDQTYRKQYIQDEKTKIIDSNIFCITEILLSCFRNNITCPPDSITISSNKFVEEIKDLFKKTEPVYHNRKLECLLKFCQCINNDKYDTLSLIARKLAKTDVVLSTISEAVAYALNNKATSKHFVNTIFSKCISY